MNIEQLKEEALMRIKRSYPYFQKEFLDWIVDQAYALGKEEARKEALERAAKIAENAPGAHRQDPTPIQIASEIRKEKG